ncbi:hypothetical protein [Actimicrobium antarcticum]|uniref:Uncharacterized protein n=1 Tax=Actimicrobium antarcticum TaxID=1051899 RepID=A0ABP7SY41_9BURK
MPFASAIQAVPDRKSRVPCPILTGQLAEGGIANRVHQITTPESVKDLKFCDADRTIDAMLKHAGASV